MLEVPERYRGSRWVVARRTVAFAATVVSALDDRPVSGAVVTVATAQGQTVQGVCGDDGVAVFCELPPGEHTVTVDAPHLGGRYRSVTQPLPLEQGKPVVREIGLPATRLMGAVMGPDGPLEGALVRVQAAGAALTDENGRFVVGPLPLGASAVQITAAGYVPYQSAQTFTASGAAVTLEVTLEPIKQA